MNKNGITLFKNFLRHPRSGVSCFSLLLLVIATFAPRPAKAQMDLAGEWSESLQEDFPERGDVAIGDYIALPINDATRMRADTWDAERWTMLEHQCFAH